MTNELNPQEMIVEEGLGAREMALVEQIKEENKNASDIQTVPNSNAIVEEKPNEISLDDPNKQPPAAEPSKSEESTSDSSGKDAETETQETETEETVALDGDKLKAFLEENKLTEEQFVEEFLKDRELPINFKGKSRKLKLQDIRSLLPREETFQRKFDNLSKSDELRLGTLMKAAQGGDKNAQKKVQKLLIDMTGAKDADGMLDNLEEVEGEFDEEKLLVDQRAKDDEDLHFSDVKDEVDFKDNLAIVETDLQKRMPPKIFKSYWKEPSSRRTMYE